MYNQQNINQKSTETPTEEDALGIKNPLLTPTTLGQNFLSLQSISPLGSRSINLINWSLISPNQTLLQNFQDNENWQDSSISEFRPFSKNSLTENSPIIEPQSDKTLPSSVPIQLSSELPIQQPPETSFIDSESPIPQPPETPSFDSESPIGQTENIFPFQIDQKTRRNSVIQNSKSSTSHFFQKKSEFPREKISQENVNKLTKKSAENQDISTTEESVINSIETNDLQTINPTDITLQKQPDSTIDNIPQTESVSTINPTGIVTPEIPVSTLQKQSDSASTINPTDILNPEIPVSTLQKQPESVSVINPTGIVNPEIPVSTLQKQPESVSTINPTDIVNPEIPVSTLQKQPESVSVINPTDIINPEIPVSTLQKQPESASTINPTGIVTPEIPVSTLQKQPESQTVAQLLRQPGAIPQLPQVLENITHSKPLGISKSLIQPSKLISETSFLQTNPMLSKDEHENVLDNLDQFASPSTINIEPKSEPNFNNESSKQGIMIQQQESDFSTSDVPDSWSSIEELLGESNSTPSKPTVVQAFFKKEGRQAKHRKHQHQTLDFPAGMLLPPGISSGVAGIHNLDLQQQPTSVKVLMEKTIQTRIQQEQKTASRKAEPVETLTRSNLGLEYHQSSSASVAQKEETKQAETKTDQVEVLAREIYGLVRQRFEIERERQGSSYDRRLF
ncbi:hypothetical protein [Planktothrix agardhii]|uniref:hypothetical protein n=1 Tax=Planktothrix agardhii TaxID=1160 RepID=UPI001D0AFF98|nr:hypothetical protein [Planktothrix agardhii]MCB8786551.1 hypothetical protein [Planktothrix agardhii 1025]